MRLNLRFVCPILIFILCFADRAWASRETDFWEWFVQHQAELFEFEQDQERIFDRLAIELHKVHPSLTFEFGPKVGLRREFVISADGVRAGFAKVESLYRTAPPLEQWTVIKFRPRRVPFDLQFNGVTVKADTVRVMLQEDGAKSGLTVIVPGYTKAARKTYLAIAFLLLEQALGEYDLETRIGFIDVQAELDVALPSYSLHDLPAVIDARSPMR